jgi:hypothetical protein
MASQEQLQKVADERFGAVNSLFLDCGFEQVLAAVALCLWGHSQTQSLSCTGGQDHRVERDSLAEGTPKKLVRNSLQKQGSTSQALIETSPSWIQDRTRPDPRPVEQFHQALVLNPVVDHYQSQTVSCEIRDLPV